MWHVRRSRASFACSAFVWPLPCFWRPTLLTRPARPPRPPRSRFQPVVVPEPTIEETFEILQGLRERYEAHHKLRYTDEALMAAAKYSSQYISDR